MRLFPAILAAALLFAATPYSQAVLHAQSPVIALSDDGTWTEKEVKKEVGPVAKAAVLALKKKDMKALAKLVLPEQGVRFSPYATVDVVKDVVLRPAQLVGALQDKTVLEWGAYDGSGDPIKLTFADYYNRFIYNRDFAKAEAIGYNQVLHQGNSLNNLKEAYPNGVFIEYHFSKSPDGNEIGWSSLRLVFEQHAGKWVLVGIVHDEWTI
jgi:hypothetical protein